MSEAVGPWLTFLSWFARPTRTVQSWFSGPLSLRSLRVPRPVRLLLDPYTLVRLRSARAMTSDGWPTPHLRRLGGRACHADGHRSAGASIPAVSRAARYDEPG